MAFKITGTQKAYPYASSIEELADLLAKEGFESKTGEWSRKSKAYAVPAVLIDTKAFNRRHFPTFDRDTLEQLMKDTPTAAGYCDWLSGNLKDAYTKYVKAALGKAACVVRVGDMYEGQIVEIATIVPVTRRDTWQYGDNESWAREIGR